MLDSPLFGILLMQLTPTPMKGLMGPAATDGRRLLYDVEAIEKFNEDEVKGVLSHEVLHVALRHVMGHKLNRTGDRDPIRWNIATDSLVNNIIRSDAKQALPEGLVKTYHDHITFGTTENGGIQTIELKPHLEEDVSHYTAEQIYERIVMPKKKEEDKGPGCGLMDPGAGQDGQPPKMSKVEEKIWEGKLKAAAQAAKKAGSLPLGMEEILEGLRPPQKDWREVLARFVQRVFEDYTYIPPDRRGQAISDELPGNYEIIFPSMSEGEVIRDLVIGIDTSGSVSTSELIDFVSETFSIAQMGLDLWLAYCDSALHYFEPLESSIAPPAPIGRGGTSFKPVFDEIKTRGLGCEGVVYLTDGMPNDGWPKKPPYPVLWIINNNEYTPPYGEVVRYTPAEGGGMG